MRDMGYDSRMIMLFSKLPGGVIKHAAGKSSGFLIWRVLGDDHESFGAFHGHGGSPKWLVYIYKGKSYLEMDDFGGNLIYGNPHLCLQCNKVLFNARHKEFI